MMQALPADRTIAVANRSCPYCCRAIEPGTRSRDHVLSRRFVPEGSLAGAANIGLWSCRRCNGIKAQLEDDISAIAMMPDTLGRYARDDERLRRTAARKARGSISDATRRPVAESRPSFNIHVPLGGLSLDFGFIARPTIDDARAALLAWFQIQGLYYFQTFSRERGYGRHLKHEAFRMAACLGRDDWGNPRFRGFQDSIRDTERVLYAVMADGYFGAVIHGLDADTIAWAVEWNEAVRCFGYWGDPARVASLLAELPQAPLQWFSGDTIDGVAIRVETPLDPEEDHLFELPPGLGDMTPPARGHWQ